MCTHNCEHVRDVAHDSKMGALEPFRRDVLVVLRSLSFAADPVRGLGARAMRIDVARVAALVGMFSGANHPRRDICLAAQ